jgi:hypothetical protein
MMAKKKKAKGKPFGGMVMWCGCDCPMSAVFGKKLPPSGQTKAMWNHFKRHGKIQK